MDPTPMPTANELVTIRRNAIMAGSRLTLCKLNNLEYQFFKSVTDVMPYIK